ncbi:hypothetical protein J1G43_11465 [Cellulomonas sp. zg-ZUI22]|uniref:hypothetical protein n=1 Tax=Cellulomonas sp. zg-ZUI22 TaxID=2816955 RepID=UPI001A93D7B8|nr:hypothetical protein [Cellulomonas sp. zg-ZUI22]MBO0900580.1 hypothetical protein [Cellulomonas sp. zg-ZUI22]
MTEELRRDMAHDAAAVVLRSRETRIRGGVLVLGVTALQLGAHEFRLGPADWITLLVVVSLMPVVLIVVTRHAMRRVVGLTPPGPFTVEVGETALCTTSPRGAAQTRWSAFGGVRVRGAAVALWTHPPHGWLVLPRALFTDADLDAVRGHIARARAASPPA